MENSNPELLQVLSQVYQGTVSSQPKLASLTHSRPVSQSVFQNTCCFALPKEDRYILDTTRTNLFCTEATTHSLEESFLSDKSTSCSHLEVSNILYPEDCQMFLRFPHALHHPSTSKKLSEVCHQIWEILSARIKSPIS